MIAAGCDVKVIAEQMGHSTVVAWCSSATGTSTDESQLWDFLRVREPDRVRVTDQLKGRILGLRGLPRCRVASSAS